MAYSLSYQLDHDIDIFLKIHNHHIIHIASAGAILPNELSQLDKLLIENKSIIYDIDHKTDILINPYLDELMQFKNKREKDLYLIDFKRIASKGIITFDKTVVEDCNDPFYHLVAYPHDNIGFLNIKNIIPIETPRYISNKIEQNIQNNIIDSIMGKEYDKFELFKNI
ncbi:hypothetical protein RT99_05385 [Flavobacterium sp. MEB061]|uniref:hypothetical protein n=1 Tax=Flavobacterium sp. MEB061 TaxID=1587524 RepID=UPI0005AD16C6|nr:hypothetical protein [Flavobacterium sp. MEB061]KIQ22942.1 hypothetical protein RT99_05385 [Flavobacterium sp. MEB061]